MYNIIHLLKCSSPALAQHFEESENSIKKLGEISVDFEKRLDNIEGEIVYTPFEKLIESQSEFIEQKRTIDGTDYTAYFQRIQINPSDKEVVYNPSFCPHCSQYIEDDSEISYTEIPLMDYDNFDVFKNQDITGFAILRVYNKNNKATDIYLLVTKRVYDSLNQTSTGAEIKYKLYV